MSIFEDIIRSRQAGGFPVNKFGKSTNVDSGVETDLWDLTSQAIWLAPTAAKIHAIVSADATDITGVGTLTFTQQPGNTETITIGTKVYTFQTTLTNVDGNVLISAVDASGSLDNLIAAINLAAGAGTTYAAAMTANSPATSATVGAGDTMIVYDETSSGGATTSTVTGGTWGGAIFVVGTSARTIRLWGLKTWSTRESSEDILMRGDVAVNTANAYVIIHRMEVLTSGTTSRNAGIIKATAADDTTITAQITALVGRTKMAIYGVPSGYKLHLVNYYGSNIKAAAALRCSWILHCNPEPDVQTTRYNQVHDNGVDTTGNSLFNHDFGVPFEIEGPCIIKLSANATAADTIAIGGFDGFVTQTALLDRTHV